MKHSTKRWPQAKYLAQQDLPFTVLSPPSWKESYTPKKKLHWAEAVAITISVALIIGACALLFDAAKLFPN